MIESTLQTGRPAWLDAQPKEEAGALESIELGFKKVKLGAGVTAFNTTLQEETLTSMFSQYADYDDNKDIYGELNDMDKMDYVFMHNMDQRQIFQLDKNNNLVNGANHYSGADALYFGKKDKIKAYLMAKKNGFTFDQYYNEYRKLDKQYKAKLNEKETSFGWEALGALGGYFAEPETLIDFMSPSKIVGKTILGGMGKAFAVEFGYAASSEIAREIDQWDHNKIVNETYSLLDSFKEVVFGATIGGTARGIGSGILDKYAKIRHGDHLTEEERALYNNLNREDQSIVDDFIEEQEISLADDVATNEGIIARAQEQIDRGEPVDIADATTRDPRDLSDPDVDEVNIFDEAENFREFESDRVAKEDVETAGEVNPDDDMFGYDSRIIEEEMSLNPELDAELKAIDEELKAHKESTGIDAGANLGTSMAGGFAGGADATINQRDYDGDGKFTYKDVAAGVAAGAISLSAAKALYPEAFKDEAGAKIGAFAGENIERKPGEKLLDYHKRKKQFQSELDTKKNQANVYKEQDETHIKREDIGDRLEVSKEAQEKIEEDYRMNHTAPSPSGSNSGYDISDVFPDSPNDPRFKQYYGTGNNKADTESISAMKKMEGKPDAKVIIYRAAPKGVKINKGDWITLSKTYAKEHGEDHMDGDYEILTLEVTAKDVYTNGDSINEWGYYPQGSN